MAESPLPDIDRLMLRLALCDVTALESSIIVETFLSAQQGHRRPKWSILAKLLGVSRQAIHKALARQKRIGRIVDANGWHSINLTPDVWFPESHQGRGLKTVAKRVARFRLEATSSDLPVVDRRERGDSARLRAAVYRRDRGICALCGTDCDAIDRANYPDLGDPDTFQRYISGEFEIPRSAWQADHITPFVEGGRDSLENLRTLCTACHQDQTKILRRRLRVRARGGILG